jgi:hypothetical protein
VIVKIQDNIHILDDILDCRRAALDDDFVAYRNHCYRVFNYCRVISGVSPDGSDKIAIAAAFMISASGQTERLTTSIPLNALLGIIWRKRAEANGATK